MKTQKAKIGEKVFVSSKNIMKRYKISYYRVNYLTKKGVFKVAKRAGNKRLYSLEEVAGKLKDGSLSPQEDVQTWEELMLSKYLPQVIFLLINTVC